MNVHRTGYEAMIFLTQYDATLLNIDFRWLQGKKERY